MTTNGEWLFSKPFDEQMAWMHEEHQDGILDGDTAALNAKIAYPMHHGYKGVKADMVIFDELHDEHDSREKLEVEASELVADYAASGEVCDPMYNGIIELLDRQAAITAHQWESYHNGMMFEWMAKTEELQEQVDELKELNEYHALQYELASEDCDRLQAQVDAKDNCIENIMQTLHETQARASNLADDLLTANRQREQYRKLFGMALDWAHEITMLESSIDEGMA